MNNSPFSELEWRSIMLQQQGLLEQIPSLPALVQQLSYVQIDSINVVERAHHHVLHSRLADYQPLTLQHAVQQGQLFEYWSHAAAFLPMAAYRFSLFRKRQLANGERHWHEPDLQLMQQLLQRIRQEGPLSAAAFAQPRRAASSGWWDWQPAKKALEQLFMHGEIMAVRGERFQKIYDLAERVIPAGTNCKVPEENDYARYLIQRYLTAHGVGTVGQIGYLRKNSKALLQPVLQQMLEQAELAEFSINNKVHYYLPQLAVPAAVENRVWLLNPFDNLLIQRDKLKQWFDFDYQIEVYVPAAKRQYGYYSLAILWQTQFVGRVDVKADRQTGTLLLQHLALQENAYTTGSVAADFISAFELAVAAYCRFNRCRRWKLVSCTDKRLKQHYRRLQHVDAD